MDASRFIARRLRFGGKIAAVSIAVSFFVMILSVSVSSGFREEIRDGVSSLTGDIRITSSDMNVLGEDSSVSDSSGLSGILSGLSAVERVTPAVYRAGIVKNGDRIHGVLFKGTPRPEGDTTRLGVRIPTRLRDLLGYAPGDRLTAYFVGEKVKVRNFTVTEVYEEVMDGSDNPVVLCDIADLQRLCGWEADEASALEVALKPRWRSPDRMWEASAGVSAAILGGSGDESLVATPVTRLYPQIFDWLTLIDFNVVIILILMTIVAGFNMISGLLIMLFRHISTIGVLKSMGMTDRSIAKVFLRVASRTVLTGMAWGNGLALLFCAIQGTTHLLKLNPVNYFVSFVPVHVALPRILLADFLAYGVILLLLLIPCLFISKVDPARTVRAQ